MEKNKNINFDNDTIIRFLGNLIPIIIIAMLTRVYLKTLTSNEFIANTFFIVIILTGIYVYMALMQITEYLTTILAKSFFNKRKMKTDNNKNEFITPIEKKDLSKISDKKQKAKLKIKKQKLEIAIKYTKEEFASYTTKEDTIKLCEYIKLYSEKGNLENIEPIKVNDLKALDIYHFGWNIWKHFNKFRNQDELAHFIKSVFKELLQDIDVTTIPKNLTKDEKQGAIKIKKEGLF